ncbi:hypothetical protein CFP56_036337 [Quercus suber]|uniref:RNase H type-1 domain-containing protein n=1 Tax=Quercus suber TaxID=58331 RepID=A0AAW0J7S9_QUESU
MSHAMEFFFLSSISAWHPSPSSSTSTRWCPTPPPYVTINTDGSSKGNLGMFGAGGMARSATNICQAKMMDRLIYCYEITRRLLCIHWICAQGRKNTKHGFKG